MKHLILFFLVAQVSAESSFYLFKGEVTHANAEPSRNIFYGDSVFYIVERISYSKQTRKFETRYISGSILKPSARVTPNTLGSEDRLFYKDSSSEYWTLSIVGRWPLYGENMTIREVGPGGENVSSRAKLVKIGDLSDLLDKPVGIIKQPSNKLEIRINHKFYDLLGRVKNGI